MKNYIRMIFVSLVSTGAILFVGNAYSSGIVGQPQFDAPVTTGNVTVAANALVNDAAATANEPAGPSAQLNATSFNAIKQTPTPKSVQNVESEFYRNEEGAPK